MIELTTEEYTALVTLARKGQTNPDAVLRLEAFLKDIERKNDIIRYLLWVQWQEVDYPLPPTVRFPETWPPELRELIELVDRPVAKKDVDDRLAQKARKPENILVTKDPAGTVGWTTYAAYFP